MKIGLLVRYCEEDLALLARHGFGSCELLVAPGDVLDPAKASSGTIDRARDDLAARGIEISAIGHYGNNLDPDVKKRQANSRHLQRLLKLCTRMDVDTLCTFAGRDPGKDIADNIPMFKRVFTPLAKRAEDAGLRIGFENCPMFHWFPFRGINIAYCPRAWDAMFDAVPSPALGLEYDPSHLICMLIDPLETIHRYGDRIVHVHAKDAELIDRELRVNGLLEPGSLRHRMPGMGDVDWPKVVSALRENGYHGNLDIEGRHDPVYQGEHEEEGLVIAMKTLGRLVA